MTDWDIHEWLAMLGATPAARIRAVNDIFYHRRGDGMSQADVKVCLRAFILLKSGIPRRPPRNPPTVTAPAPAAATPRIVPAHKDILPWRY